jgi:hypothetical protein
MEWTSLHPLNVERVRVFLESLRPDDPAFAGLGAAERGDERGSAPLTLGLARFIAEGEPIFFHDGLSLTTFEARIDRGIGMLMRPPSRLFMDAGLDASVARALPIRLDLQQGAMGGAYVPARLIPDMRRILDERMKRIILRLSEAEYDAVPALGLLIEATDYVASRGLGLYEAIDAVASDQLESLPAGSRLLLADPKRLDRDLRKRLEAAAKPEKQPGLIKRVFTRWNSP